MFDLSGFFAEWLEAVPSTGVLVATFVVVCGQQKTTRRIDRFY